MPGVFISYRRDDSSGYAGRLYEALVAHFGRGLIFIDVDSVRAGEDFVDAIKKRIASCSVVVVLIGKGWLKSVDDQGHRRLEDPRDFVRLEITSALLQNVPVIPVLVGGAKMPRPEDLPAPLTPLAHLNAIEIFDQLYHESLKRFISALRPFVYPKRRLWPWARPIPRKARLLLATIALLATLGIPVIRQVLEPSSEHNTTKETAPPPGATLAGPDNSNSDSVKVRVLEPVDVSQLPPVVEASRNVLLPGSSDQVTGPRKPHIAWRAAVTVGDAWEVLGISADGTVYVYDRENHVLDALRDGKEQWAYSAPYGFSPIGFSPDGRLWLEGSGVNNDYYCFNSRGEGGRVTRKALRPDGATLRLARPNAYRQGCSGGKVYAMNPHGKKTWTVDLDGNCGLPGTTSLGQSGDVYASSDVGTLYSISSAGQVLWTVKQACKKSYVNVFPLPLHDLIVACKDESLYSLREGKTRWTSTTVGIIPLGGVIFDQSENIYIGAKGPSAVDEVAALDNSGQLTWTVPSGTMGPPALFGFDSAGRLYVGSLSRIVCLSD